MRLHISSPTRNFLLVVALPDGLRVRFLSHATLFPCLWTTDTALPLKDSGLRKSIREAGGKAPDQDEKWNETSKITRKFRSAKTDITAQHHSCFSDSVLGRFITMNLHSGIIVNSKNHNVKLTWYKSVQTY